MSDQQLRALERRVQAGDLDAGHQLARARRRVGLQSWPLWDLPRPEVELRVLLAQRPFGRHALLADAIQQAEWDTWARLRVQPDMTVEFLGSELRLEGGAVFVRLASRREWLRWVFGRRLGLEPTRRGPWVYGLAPGQPKPGRTRKRLGSPEELAARWQVVADFLSWWRGQRGQPAELRRPERGRVDYAAYAYPPRQAEARSA